MLLLSTLFVSCHRGSGGGKSDGKIQVIDIEAPAGLAGQAVSRCDRDRQRCEPVAASESISDGTLIATAASARSSFALDPTTTLEIGEEADVYIASKDHIEAKKGYLAVRKLSDDKGEPFRIDLAGRSAEIDPKLDGTVVVRAKGPDHATVTVEKGKLTLRSSGGQSMMLLSGETADLIEGKPPERIASFIAVEPHDKPKQPLQIAQAEPRGLGRMTARVPGRTEVVSGVRLVSHHVDVVLRDGLARTEIEEVFQNDTAQVLEGRYVFPLPADASISRLALWVNDKLVEGEIVEKARAATIFKTIVDDTVRPRDPALLEWVAGGDFSLKIFPLPAKGSRKVRLAYDQVLKESGGRVRYAYPLSVGAERATTIDDFSAEVRASDTRAKLGEVETPRYATSKSGDERSFHVAFHASQFVPADDFIVSYARDREDEAEVSAYVPAWGELKGVGLDGAARGADGAGYFALRVRADLPGGMSLDHVRRDRAIVIDTSHSQSKETLDGEARIAAGLVRQLDADERFAVLACDSACVAYPESGLASPTSEHLAALDQWLAARTPSGSSDLAGALIDGARRLAPSAAGQLVYVGDGSPTSGELSAAAIADRVRGVMGERNLDLRFLGVGRAVDEIVVGSLSGDLGATYEPVVTGDSLEQRIADIGMALRSPVIRHATVELPESFGDVYPRRLRNLRLGEQVVLVGRLSGNEAGEVKLRGELEGQPYSLARAVRWTPEASRQNPLVPRLWSLSRISDLESANDAATVKQIVDLSKRYHVMSRYTSLLVLENDRMFADYGIKRTVPPPSGMPSEDLAIGKRAEAPAQSGSGFGAAHGKLDDFTVNDRARESAGPAKSESAPAANGFATPPPPAAMAAPAGVAAAPQPAPASPPAAMRRADKASEAEFEGRAAEPMPSAVEQKMAPPRPSDLMIADELGRDLSTTTGASSHPLTMIAPTGNVQIGAPQVNGSLPIEVIRRVATQSAGRMKLCYERGLRGRPNLAGRVGVRFVIGPNGEVLSAMDGGSSLGDPETVACVLAVMRAVVFPRPAAGFVTVTLPVTFSRTPLPAPLIVRTDPTATHRLADDSWRSKSEDVLSRLRAAVEQNPGSRKKHEDLVRGLLARGRFEEALAAAKRFVSLDPDLPVARELLAYAAITNDDTLLAASSLDTQTETDPSGTKWHVRAARSFEALGDERRACAHWRSLFQLVPRSDEFGYEALRCRARILDEQSRALAEARGMSKPGKWVSQLIGQLETGAPPPFSKSIAGPGQFEAEVTCSSGERCPTVVVISPRGNVFSPFTPTDSRSGAKSVAFAGIGDGTFMTILTGGSPDARGEVQLRAFGSTRKFSFGRGGAQTVAATQITFPVEPSWERMEGFVLAR